MTGPIRVLLVEDNPGDAELTCEQLEHGRLAVDVATVNDGAKALDYLFRNGAYAAAPVPDLILLDLNLPKRGGREVLAAMRADEALRRIPVVVLTSSDAERDILESYELGANCYVTKPVGVAAYQKTVREIEAFWFGVAKLPS